MTKRLISLLLTVVMVFSSLIMPALAADMEEPLPEDGIFEVEVPAEGEENAPADAPEEPADSEGDQDKEEVPPQNEDDVDPADKPAGEDVKTPDDEDTNDNAAEQAGAIVAAPENAGSGEADSKKLVTMSSLNGVMVYDAPQDLTNVVNGGTYLSNVRAILSLINDMRSTPLQYDFALEQIAMGRAAEQVKNQGSTRPDGQGRFNSYYYEYNGTRFYPAAETFYNPTSYVTAEQAFTNMQRLDSNMLSSYNTVGIACFVYNGMYHWIIEYGYSSSGMGDPYVGQFNPSPDNLLDTPKISSLTETTDGVQIQWGAVTGAKMYRVFYKTTSSWAMLADVTGTSYTWTGGKAGTTYTFTVRCLNTNRALDTTKTPNDLYASDFDRYGKSITFRASDVDTPVLIDATLTSTNAITIRWNPVSGAAMYRLFYKVSGGNWTKIVDLPGPTTNSYTWRGSLKSGTTYYFTVRCMTPDASGYTSGFDTTGVSCTYYAPVGTAPQPKISSLTAAANGITVKWNAVSGAAKYRLFVKEDGAPSWTVVAVTTATSYTWSGPSGGTTSGPETGKKYIFTVRSLASDGQLMDTSTYDPNNCGEIIFNNASAPIITDLRNVAQGIYIEWGAVPNVKLYRVFYKVPGSGWTALTDTAQNSFTWTSAKPTVTYTFTVRCLSADGKSYISTYDTVGKSIICSALANPVITSTASTANGLQINWRAVAGAAKYRVFYKVAGTGWTKLVDTTATSYTWPAAKPSTSYYFTVRCLSADGTSYTSYYDTTGTPATFHYINTAPDVLSAQNVTGGIEVTWKAVSSDAKYRLFYKIGPGSWIKLVDTVASSYIWTGAQAGTRYTFTVRCINGDGSAYNSGLGATMDCVCAAFANTPLITSLTNTSTGIQINWGAVSGAVQYRVFYKIGASWTKLVDTAATSYHWTGASPNTSYTFTVRCMSASGTYTSGYDPIGETIIFYPVSEMPKVTSVANAANGVTISWGAVSGAAQYRVFYKLSTGGWIKIADTTATSYTWTGAQAGVTYIFTVRCLSADGSRYTSSFDTTGFTFTKS